MIAAAVERAQDTARRAEREAESRRAAHSAAGLSHSSARGPLEHRLGLFLHPPDGRRPLTIVGPCQIAADKAFEPLVPFNRPSVDGTR